MLCLTVLVWFLVVFVLSVFVCLLRVVVAPLCFDFSWSSFRLPLCHASCLHTPKETWDEQKKCSRSLQTNKKQTLTQKKHNPQRSNYATTPPKQLELTKRKVTELRNRNQQHTSWKARRKEGQNKRLLPESTSRTQNNTLRHEKSTVNADDSAQACS